MELYTNWTLSNGGTTSCMISQWSPNRPLEILRWCPDFASAWGCFLSGSTLWCLQSTCLGGHLDDHRLQHVLAFVALSELSLWLADRPRHRRAKSVGDFREIIPVHPVWEKRAHLMTELLIHLVKYDDLPASRRWFVGFSLGVQWMVFWKGKWMEMDGNGTFEHSEAEENRKMVGFFKLGPAKMRFQRSQWWVNGICAFPKLSKSLCSNPTMALYEVLTV